jgi:hypothetical protein
MIGLVDLLRQRNVYYELHVYPDVTHDDNVVHAQWLAMWEGMGDFLNRFVRDAQAPPKMASGVHR